jgi:hypothetical protein
MSGRQLAKRLVQDLSESASGNLDEVTSILCMKHGRAAVIAAVRRSLNPLLPTGGLLALPTFSWAAIYSTNYDRLVEVSYQRQNQPLTVIRSNYDWSRIEHATGTTLFKMHGCVSQDEVDGHKSRMILTEEDFEQAHQYREALFKRLELDLTTKDVVIIGHSLGDPDLRSLMTEAVRIQQSAGGSGRLFALIYEADNDRAQLLENRGFRIAFGGIDEFVHALANAIPAPPEQLSFDLSVRLGPALLASTISVPHALTLSSNATKLYNGSPAQYADIRTGLTFQRTQEQLVETLFASDDHFICIILGVAGVGKTTLARRIVRKLADGGADAWEHKNIDLTLKVDRIID